MAHVRNRGRAARCLGMSVVTAAMLAACGGGGGQDGNGPAPAPATPVSQRTWTAPESLPEGTLLHGPSGPLFAVRAGVDGLGQPWTLQVRAWANGSWGAAQVVHAFSFRRFPPDYRAAVDATGNLYVMWEDNGVQLRRRDARSGQWGRVQRVGAGDEGTPWALQATRGGDVLVVWVEAGQTQVTRWSAAATLSATHSLEMMGRARFNDRGQGLVVVPDVSQGRILWSGYAPESGWTTPRALEGDARYSGQFLLSTPAADGSIWLVTRESSGPTSDASTTHRLLAQRYDPARGWQSAQVVSDSLSWQELADVDVHSDGSLLLSWKQGRASVAMDLMTKAWSPVHGWRATQRLLTGLSLWTSSALIGLHIPPESPVSNLPQVAIGPGGAALASWITCDRAPDPEPLLAQFSACTVWSSRIDNIFAAGAAWADPQSMTSSSLEEPLTQFRVEDLHMLPSGDAALVRTAPPEGRVLQRLPR